MGKPVLASFDLYVRRRLEAWGDEFKLDRAATHLGYPSKNMLQVLFEHRGEIPERVEGYKPLTIPPMEWQTETIVHDMHHACGYLAATLRAYYCGSGRVGVERREALEKMLGYKVNRRAFFQYHELAFNWVTGALLALAREDASLR